MHKKILIFVLIFSSGYSNAQDLRYGYTVGLAFSFGSETNRLGLRTAAYLNYDFVQVNSALNIYYNFKSLGLQQKSIEFQWGNGFQLGFGKDVLDTNNFIGLTENNTLRYYSAGYTFMRYWDRLGTSQSTGIINVNFWKVNIITENDLFGNIIRQQDRFRTGAFRFELRHNNTKVGMNALLWTHDYSHCAVIVNEGSKKWSRFGYYQDEASQTRNASLGILSVDVKQWLPYNQMVGLNIGINSEKIRNVMQNEFIHDQPFFPDKLVKRKPAHIPMFTIDDKPYLHDDDNPQTIRPAKFYYNFGLNNMPFY
ncbi:MAG: hypothetical protein ACI8ZM_001186 [Crocinitomix sp.]|jgi:hypothetical protein